MNNMNYPAFLKNGDKIGLISTARKVQAKEIILATETIHKWGYETVIGNHLHEVFHQFAGTDQQRAADLQLMLENTEIKAILCLRGGYSTLRIIDHIDFSTFVQNPKWIAGYSDITVLHSHIHSLFDLPTLHSTMPIHFMEDFSDTMATSTLKAALCGNLKQLEYTILSHPLNRIGQCKGKLIGGNLSILYALCGSISDIDTDGKILFIEDLDEYLYHIDRMMLNLKRSGKLANLAGLIIGGMSDMKDNLVPYGKNAYEIIAEHVSEFTYPVCFNFPAGHIPDNRSIILGHTYELVINDTNSLFTPLPF